MVAIVVGDWKPANGFPVDGAWKAGVLRFLTFLFVNEK